MSNQVTLTYYGMEGTGRTLTEAKRDAGAKIEKALSGSYTPTILHYRGYTALVAREPAGWDHRLIGTPEGITEGRAWMSGGNHETEKEAIRAAQHHLASLGWVESDGLDVPDFITDRNDRAELASQFAFHLRYKAARRAGLTDHEAHYYAGRAPGWDGYEAAEKRVLASMNAVA